MLDVLRIFQFDPTFVPPSQAVHFLHVSPLCLRSTNDSYLKVNVKITVKMTCNNTGPSQVSRNIVIVYGCLLLSLFESRKNRSQGILTVCYHHHQSPPLRNQRIGKGGEGNRHGRTGDWTHCLMLWRLISVPEPCGMRKGS